MTVDEDDLEMDPGRQRRVQEQDNEVCGRARSTDKATDACVGHEGSTAPPFEVEGCDAKIKKERRCRAQLNTYA